MESKQLPRGTQIVYVSKHVKFDSTHPKFHYPNGAYPGYIESGPFKPFADNSDEYYRVRYWHVENGKITNDLRTLANSELTPTDRMIVMNTVPQSRVMRSMTVVALNRQKDSLTEIDSLLELLVFGDRKKKPDFLIKLYNSVLVNDNKFHFIDEEGMSGFLLIRYSPELDTEVREFCDHDHDQELEFWFNGCWKERSDTVVKYSHDYMVIFHAVSRFLLNNITSLKQEDEFGYRDRIFHIIFNMIHYLGLTVNNEPAFFSSIANGRAFTWGYYLGQKSLKESQSDTENGLRG